MRAGQVAVFLAEAAKIVQMLVRSEGLVENMSRCLIRRIEETPKIVLRPLTEIVALEGGDHLESVRWRNTQIEHREEHKVGHVVVMTGAAPNTSWLDGCVTLDAKGFIETGSDPSPENLSAARWPLLASRISSKPLCREFSRWVTCEAAASSVLRPRWECEGSIATSFIHKVLQE